MLRYPHPSFLPHPNHLAIHAFKTARIKSGFGITAIRACRAALPTFMEQVFAGSREELRCQGIRDIAAGA